MCAQSLLNILVIQKHCHLTVIIIIIIIIMFKSVPQNSDIWIMNPNQILIIYTGASQ